MIDASVARYERLVHALVAVQVSREALWSVLQSRDEVARDIAGAPSPLPLALAARLDAADKRLRSCALRIVDVVSSDTLESWRHMTGAAAPGSWWWSLETVAAGSTSPFWSIGTALAVTLSLALFAVSVTRFFEGGPDFAGAILVACQAVLTFLAGSTLTASGGGGVARVMDRQRVRPSRRPMWSFAFALVVLALSTALRASLPAFADLYNARGLEQWRERDWAAAIGSFDRALALNPDFVAARFNLALTYEDVGDYDNAISWYRRSLTEDSQFVRAYNNLARLLILHEEDYASALHLLDRAETLNAKDPEASFSILKNKAWANLKLENLKAAEFELHAAIVQDGERASAHCLLAQVYERTNDVPASAREWCQCTSSQTRDAEPEWLERASDRFESGRCGGSAP